MTKENKDKLKNQRVFEHASGRYILLTKAGRAVSFWVDERDRIHVLEELEDVDFKATGTLINYFPRTHPCPGFPKTLCPVLATQHVAD